MLTACATRQVAAAAGGTAAATAAHMVCLHPTPRPPTPSPEPRAQAEEEHADLAEALRRSEKTFRAQVARQAPTHRHLHLFGPLQHQNIRTSSGHVHPARPASGALASTPDALLLIVFRRASTSCMIIPAYDIEAVRFWVPEDCKRWESIMGSNAIRISAAVIFIAAIMAWV